MKLNNKQKKELDERRKTAKEENYIPWNEAKKQLKVKKKDVNQPLTPITLEEFYAKIDDSEKAYREGKVISGKQLRKEIRNS